MIIITQTELLKMNRVFNLFSIEVEPDPSSYSEATKVSHWRSSMMAEYDPL